VGNYRPGGTQWQPTVGFMIHVTCRLTAKNRDQLPNPTLGSRVWATFTFFNHKNISVIIWNDIYMHSIYVTAELLVFVFSVD